MEVHNQLNCGFDEAVQQEQSNWIGAPAFPVARKSSFHCATETWPQDVLPQIVCLTGRASRRRPHPARRIEEAQVINYLKATGLKWTCC